MATDEKVTWKRSIVRVLDLLDVNGVKPTNGQILKYVASTAQWVSSTVSIATADIVDGAVTAAKLAANSVTTTKIADGNVTAAKLASGAATDGVVGNRTVSDTVSPSSNTDALTNILGFLANRLKAITGKPDWKTSPATTLETANTHIVSTSNPHSTTAAQVNAVSKSGDTMLGDLIVGGDIRAYRSAATTTGAVFFGSTGAKYWYHNGTDFIANNTAGGYRFRNNDTDQFLIGSDGKLFTNQIQSGDPSGTIGSKIPIYNISGTLIGYIAVYV